MARKNKNEFNFFDSEYFGGDALGAIIGEEKKPAFKSEHEVLEEAGGYETEIPVSELIDYGNHTFSVEDNEDMEILVDSIRDYGIFTPLIVRQISENKYEVLSGHRRKFAAKKAGLETVPCHVIEADDDMADIIAVDTNLSRSTIKPSEKARSYKVRFDAAVRQGKKKMDSMNEIAGEATDSMQSIRRYLKLATLNPTLLFMIDDGRIPMNAGVNLAALSEKHQDIVTEILAETGADLTLKMSEDLKTAAARGLTMEKARAIISGETKTRKARKPEKKASANIFAKVSAEDREYLLSYSASHGMTVEDVIAECVKLLKEGV